LRNQLDVRDLAKLQVAALTTPAAANKRFIVGRPMIFNDIATALRSDSNLKLAGRVGDDNDEASTLTLPRLDIKETEKVFGIEWTPLEVTVRDVAKALLEIEVKA
jgi:hypothetical protein